MLEVEKVFMVDIKKKKTDYQQKTGTKGILHNARCGVAALPVQKENFLSQVQEAVDLLPVRLRRFRRHPATVS